MSLCIGAAALLLWSTLVDGLATVAAVRGSHLQALAIGWLIAWPILWLVASWFAVGVWRAARSGPWRGRGAIGTLLALAVALLIVAGVLANALGSARTSLSSMASLARHVDPLGALQMQVSADGQVLTLIGAIGAGDGERVRSALAAQPRLQRVDLNSPGGRLAEANRWRRRSPPAAS